GTGRDGAPTWPPSPQRSERSGAAVALLRAWHWARWGPDMAPKPPTFGALRRSRGAPQGLALGEMGAPTWGPQAPNVRSAPAQPWRSSGPGTGRDGGPDMARKPPTFGAARRSRGGSSGSGPRRDGAPDL